MPTYDYECDGCGKTLEVFQSMSDAPKKKCPACGRRRLRRLIGTGGAILFKGSGFYTTDYRSESYKAGAKADAKSDCAAKPSAAKPSTCKADGCGPKADA